MAAFFKFHRNMVSVSVPTHDKMSTGGQTTICSDGNTSPPIHALDVGTNGANLVLTTTEATLLKDC